MESRNNLDCASRNFAPGWFRYVVEIAAIMGLTQAAIPVVLTCVVGLLLGMSGAWLGSAVRSLVASQPATSR